jgi:hypothetical protein
MLDGMAEDVSDIGLPSHMLEIPHSPGIVNGQAVNQMLVIFFLWAKDCRRMGDT